MSYGEAYKRSSFCEEYSCKIKPYLNAELGAPNSETSLYDLISKIVIDEKVYVEAGDNVTITGTGYVTDPYIINAALAVVTAGTGITVTGTGTTTDPYVVSTAVFAKFMQQQGVSLVDGQAVTIGEDGKVKAAKEGDVLYGITCPKTNMSDSEWHGKYLKDDFGNEITKMSYEPAVRKLLSTTKPANENDVKLLTAVASGQIALKENSEEAVKWNKIKTQLKPVHTRVLSPAYDPNKKYIPRTQRDEWVAVKTSGEAFVRHDGSAKTGGFVDLSSTPGVMSSSDSGYLVVEIKGTLAKILLK